MPDNLNYSNVRGFFSNLTDFHSFICVGGKRAAPPEDCGGSHGYERILKILNKPQHREHKELKAWVGVGFDPEENRAPMFKMSVKEIEQKYGPELKF